MGSARLGSGILIARLDDGTWSAPSAIALAGLGGGGQVGFELADFVFILRDEGAVRAFSQSGTFTLGGNISLAFGPIGRIAEGAEAAGSKGAGGIYAYSTTRGLFGGVSLEGSVLVERSGANRKLYGGDVTAHQLLSGAIQPPPEADPLMEILNSHMFSPESSQESPAETSGEPEHPSEPPPELPSQPPSLPALDFSQELPSQRPSEPSQRIPSQNPSEAPPELALEPPARPPPEPPSPHTVPQNTSASDPEQPPEARAH